MIIKVKTGILLKLYEYGDVHVMKARKIYCNFEFQRRSHTMTEINLNRAQMTKTV